MNALPELAQTAVICDFFHPYVTREVTYALEDVAIDFADMRVSTITTKKMVGVLKKQLEFIKPKVSGIRYQNTSDSIFVIVTLKSGETVGLRLELFEDIDGGFDHQISKVSVV